MKSRRRTNCSLDPFKLNSMSFIVKKLKELLFDQEKDRGRTELCFFCLEEYRPKTNTFHQLNINIPSTDDAKTIFQFCCSFYSKLYKSNYNTHVASHFIDSVNNVNIEESSKKIKINKKK